MKLLRCSFFFTSFFFGVLPALFSPRFFYHITTYKSRLVFLFNVSSYHPFSDRTRRWRRQRRGKQSTAIHQSTPSSQSGLWVIARNLRVYLIIRSQTRNTLTAGGDVRNSIKREFSLITECLVTSILRRWYSKMFAQSQRNDRITVFSNIVHLSVSNDLLDFFNSTEIKYLLDILF